MSCARPVSPWRYRFALIALACLLVLSAGLGHTHALAPALLSLQSETDGHYAVAWKVPLQRVAGNELRPLLPPACVAVSEPTAVVEGTGLVTRWSIDCGAAGLVGKTLAVEGIGPSRADVLLRIGDRGVSLQRVLTATDPAFTVPEQQDWAGVFRQYTLLGVEHLLLGLDHVLFVVALVLLVHGRGPLIKTITSFTVGHSVTLSAAVLGFVRFPQALAEVMIAVSIIVAFAAVIRDDPRSLLKRWPWVMAFCFGLLHGLGFAGALTEVGLPPADIPLALLAFNVGIELGQLFLIALLLISANVVRKLLPWFFSGWRAVPIYAVGTLSGFWFWQRLMGILG